MVIFIFIGETVFIYDDYQVTSGDYFNYFLHGFLLGLWNVGSLQGKVDGPDYQGGAVDLKVLGSPDQPGLFAFAEPDAHGFAPVTGIGRARDKQVAI